MLSKTVLLDSSCIMPELREHNMPIAPLQPTYTYASNNINKGAQFSEIATRHTLQRIWQRWKQQNE